MSEVSFTFRCNLDSLLFICNYKLYNLEYFSDGKNIIIKLNSPKTRVSFEKGKYFDMHNLLVKKGKEGEELIRQKLNEFSNVMKEGLEFFHNQQGIPVSLLMKFLSEIENIYLDPKKYLDFEVNTITLDVNKEFIKDKPNFATNRKITLEVGSNKGCAKLIIPENGEIKYYYSTDCIEWNEDYNKYKNILQSLHTSILEINEIVSYMKKVI